jgi:hypothetical protein
MTLRFAGRERFGFARICPRIEDAPSVGMCEIIAGDGVLTNGWSDRFDDAIQLHDQRGLRRSHFLGCSEGNALAILAT